MHLEAATFVVTDTETTGTRADRDRLIEVGAVKVRGGEVVGTFQHLLDPQRHVPRRITHITGISTAMVFGEPPAAEVLPGFLEFLGDGVLVAHNLPFDARFLKAELERAGLPTIENEAVCTLRLARRLLPSLPSRGLDALARHFRIPNRARHRALGDAEVTADLLLRFLERLQSGFGLETVDDLVAFQRKRYKDATGEPKHVRKIREDVLPTVPDRPGVYTFRRRNGEVLYVGKAKVLANRVRSYFSGIDAHPAKTRKLVRDLRVVEWEETGTELGALLLESKRIKTFLPRYNRAQRRYRDYPFLRLDADSAYPRLDWTQTLDADGAEYYGPVGSRRSVEEVVELIGRLFGLRACDPNVWQAAEAARQPCLYAQIGRCIAPCTGTQDAEYAAEVERVRAFLRGEGDEVLAAVEAAMHEAAERLEFEQAGWYRDQHARLTRMLARQRPFGRPVHDLHAVLVEPDARGGGQAFVLRHGRLAEQLRLKVPTPPEAADALRDALARHFDETAAPRPLGRPEIDEMRILAYWVRQAEKKRAGRERLVHWSPGDSTDALAGTVLRVAAACCAEADMPRAPEPESEGVEGLLSEAV